MMIRFTKERIYFKEKPKMQFDSTENGKYLVYKKDYLPENGVVLLAQTGTLKNRRGIGLKKVFRVTLEMEKTEGCFFTTIEKYFLLRVV